jgi:hypothetical protein
MRMERVSDIACVHLYTVNTCRVHTINPGFSAVRPASCKPVSVPLRAAAILLDRTLLPGSSDLPESKTERAAPPLLFGLAPRGVCHADTITRAAVRSYRTISPLPVNGRYIFCCTFRRSCSDRPAVSRHAALWRPDFPPPFPGATTCPAASLEYCRISACASVRRSTSNRHIRLPISVRYSRISVYSILNCALRRSEYIGPAHVVGNAVSATEMI